MNEDERSVPDALEAPAGDEVLQLARADSDASRHALRRFSPGQLAAAVGALRPAERMEFLELVERVEEIVPQLAESDFTSTIRAVGIADAGWLVEFASAEQRVAAVDLDCWRDLRLSPSRLFDWIDALIEAGEETLLAAMGELDPEVWVLAMKEMADFVFPGGETDGLLTEDGFVFYDPRSAEDEERLQAILRVARERAPSHYWGFVYGAMSESRAECEQFAARWQRGRLADLGFPDRDRAMRAYRPLRAEDVAIPVVDTGAPHSAVSHAEPPELLAGTLVGRGLRALSAERASEVLGVVLAVANGLAVADELALSDDESVQASLRKALRGIERGLAELSALREQPLSVVLDRVEALDLFRVGVGLDAELRPHRSAADLLADEEHDDWDVETEEVEPESRTLASDGGLARS